jgi:tRNA(Ile)-lysidine synthase
MEEQARMAYQHSVTRRRAACGTTNNYELLLNHKTFQNLHRALAFRVLERCCIDSGYKPNSKQLESLNTLLFATKHSGEIHLGGCVRAAKKGPYLVFSRTLAKNRAARNQLPTVLSPRTILSPGRYDIKELGKVLRLTVKEVSSVTEKNFDELLIDYNTVTFPLLLRAAQAGERFFPCNGIGEKKVNRFFNQSKIPASTRHLYPVLLENDKIVAIPGLQVDQRYRITCTTVSVLFISWNDKEEDRCDGDSDIL